MTDEQVSRRGFLVKTSAAASLAAASSSPTAAQESQSENKNDDDYVQSQFSLRAKALVSVLTKKNLIDATALDDIIDYYETRVDWALECQEHQRLLPLPTLLQANEFRRFDCMPSCADTAANIDS